MLSIPSDRGFVGSLVWTKPDAVGARAVAAIVKAVEISLYRVWASSLNEKLFCLARNGCN
jgi:hypothetical protein